MRSIEDMYALDKHELAEIMGARMDSNEWVLLGLAIAGTLVGAVIAVLIFLFRSWL